MKKLLASAVLGAGALALAGAPSAQAAPTFYFGDGKKLEIFQMVQVWNVYGLNVDIPGQTGLKDNRNDLYIRRGRFGFQGNLRKDISFRVWFAYDNLGKDDLNTVDAARGSVKTGGLNYSKLEIWDAYFTWKANPEWANISIGYFRPQIGRESITSGFNVLTFEKALPNFYVRRHTIGSPDTSNGSFASANGRAYNVTLGGLHLDQGWSLNYNFALVDNQNYQDAKNWSPQFTARVAFTLGDPEMEKYKLGYKHTYFGKRNGITAAVNYSHQGKGIDRTARKYDNSGNLTKDAKFDKNEMYGFDILANYGYFDLVAEYDILKRNWASNQIGSFSGKSYTDKVWSVTAGYLIPVGKQFVQIAGAYSVFDPDDNGNSIYGKKKNTWYDIGVNWYINKQRLKINLHYAYGKVDNSSGSDAAKSSYIGLGFQFIY